MTFHSLLELNKMLKLNFAKKRNLTSKAKVFLFKHFSQINAIGVNIQNIN